MNTHKKIPIDAVNPSQNTRRYYLEMGSTRY
jgi:hypothetical protein